MSKWIATKNSLPESGKHVLTFYQNNLFENRTIKAFYAKRFSIESNNDLDANDEYDEETDNYYLIEGWYEVIENWPEYSSIFVSEHEVTYWQLLQDPPENIV